MSSISKAGAGEGVDVQLECSASASKKETRGMRQVSQYQIVDIVELFLPPNNDNLTRLLGFLMSLISLNARRNIIHI